MPAVLVVDVELGTPDSGELQILPKNAGGIVAWWTIAMLVHKKQVKGPRPSNGQSRLPGAQLGNVSSISGTWTTPPTTGRRGQAELDQRWP